jgi:hypothetical protein
LLTLGNILHSSLVDATTSGGHALLLAMGWRVGVVAMGWRVGVALSWVLLWSRALSSEVTGKAIVEAGVGGGSHSRWYR